MPDRVRRPRQRRPRRSPTFRQWEAAGGPSVEQAAWPTCPTAAPAPTRPDRARRAPLRPRHRPGLAAHLLLRADPRRRGAPGRASSEPEVVALDDETDDEAAVEAATSRRSADARGPAPTLASPMDDLPAGATFGSLVHAVLEEVDPLAPDLRGRAARRRVREQLVWWPVDGAGRRPRRRPACRCTTPRSARWRRVLHPGRRGLRRPAPRARLRDPARGRRPREARPPDATPGRRRAAAAHAPRRRRPAAPLRRRGWSRRPGRAVAARLPLRVDRRRAAGARADGGPRYLVVDYKTNRLGERRRPLTAADYARTAADRGDAALRLPPAGAALHRGRAPLPALAPARLRPGRAPRRRALPLRARHVRARHPVDRRPPGRGLRWLPPAGAVSRALRPARRPAPEEAP